MIDSDPASPSGSREPSPSVSAVPASIPIAVEEKRKQVADQCRVVAHLATALAKLHADYAKIFDGGHADVLIEQVGERTAEFMETLGNILNDMDAVSDEDEWINPIFAEAHRLWPVAQGIEARSAETGTGSVHESPTATPVRPTTDCGEPSP